ncbi:uncharacterized protein AKAME5_002959600 [Lates japonicus]|uniref:Uncharacterized protein n=1 Tax=Lates japonicus TaxID=270547 RepID=A0AAD3M7G7_LATJO|nr:uncharacterized protein AKAME5_002959400 [Lates japonicus]GLD48683.1 uncharacterized protein AKAME5_002959600 [Lates japonicus]
MSTGNSYIIKDYGLRDEAPPYSISINKKTMFFKTAPVVVSEELRRQAEALIEPSSQLKKLMALLLWRVR